MILDQREQFTSRPPRLPLCQVAAPVLRNPFDRGSVHVHLAVHDPVGAFRVTEQLHFFWGPDGEPRDAGNDVHFINPTAGLHAQAFAESGTKVIEASRLPEGDGRASWRER